MGGNIRAGYCGLCSALTRASWRPACRTIASEHRPGGIPRDGFLLIGETSPMVKTTTKYCSLEIKTESAQEFDALRAAAAVPHAGPSDDAGQADAPERLAAP